MKYRYIKNHVATVAQEIDDPWARPWPYPALLVEKSAWRQWCADPNTEHCFFSCCEGVAPGSRINDDNPVYSVSGLVADFDAFLDMNQLDKFKKKVSEFGPNWVCQTFSENARFGWDFEKPLLIAGPKHYARFAEVACKNLKMQKLHGGFELKALQDSAKYYDVGRKCVQMEDGKIPSATLELWSFEAARKVSMAPQEYKVPMEAVAAEVERRWPGRWRGPFAPGARGVRFWDPQADNESAAIVMNEGMLCYTGGQPFVTWREILGAQFCRQFEAQQIKAAVEGTYYDGRAFWSKGPQGLWMPSDKGDFSQRLRTMGYDSGKARGKTYSQIDEIEQKIKVDQRVDAAAPFIYRPEGIITFNNMRFLNISRAKCMEPYIESLRKPNPTFADLEERCGRLLYPYFKHLFGGENDQLWHLLAWIKLRYVNGYRQTPTRTQAIALVGRHSVGKTFLIQAVLAPLFGGYADGNSFLTGETKWTSELALSPMIVMDDGTGTGGDLRDHTKYTQRLKAIIANGELMFAQKFGAEQRIEWLGAIILACNPDSHSMIKSLPDMDLSIKNKLMLLLTSDKPFRGFLSIEENQAILAEELPWFASWLMDWNPPECVQERDERRFGLNAYHHPDLIRDVNSQGYDEITWTVIVNMLDKRAENFKTAKVAADPMLYRADLVQLHSDLVATNPTYMRDLKVRVLLLCLQSLSKKGKPVTRELSASGTERWVIDLRSTLKTENK